MGSSSLTKRSSGSKMKLLIICMVFLMSTSVKAQNSNSTTPSNVVCEDTEEKEGKCEQRKKNGRCSEDSIKEVCRLTCEECTPANITTLPPTNITTLPPITECEGVVEDKESLEFCEKKKDKNKCEQFKMDCLVTCGFCNPNITTNVTTLPPTNVTTLPPTTECEGVVEDKESLEFCEKKKDKNKCEQFKMDCKKTCDQ